MPEPGPGPETEAGPLDPPSGEPGWGCPGAARGSPGRRGAAIRARGARELRPLHTKARPREPRESGRRPGGRAPPGHRGSAARGPGAYGAGRGAGSRGGVESSEEPRRQGARPLPSFSPSCLRRRSPPRAAAAPPLPPRAAGAPPAPPVRSTARTASGRARPAPPGPCPARPLAAHPAPPAARAFPIARALASPSPGPLSFPRRPPSLSGPLCPRCLGALLAPLLFSAAASPVPRVALPPPLRPPLLSAPSSCHPHPHAVRSHPIPSHGIPFLVPTAFLVGARLRFPLPYSPPNPTNVPRLEASNPAANLHACVPAAGTPCTPVLFSRRGVWGLTFHSRRRHERAVCIQERNNYAHCPWVDTDPPPSRKSFGLLS
ncbi:uncharacterized protein LOC141567709 [Rhinolophus sinicus]|uniref:uncharacterized protein LOC141567709 n=1 Tax=Rhinolophus sinicus TaxID=89399 RepID=UPI003D7A6665